MTNTHIHRGFPQIIDLYLFCQKIGSNVTGQPIEKLIIFVLFCFVFARKFSHHRMMHFPSTPTFKKIVQGLWTWEVKPYFAWEELTYFVLKCKLLSKRSDLSKRGKIWGLEERKPLQPNLDSSGQKEGKRERKGIALHKMMGTCPLFPGSSLEMEAGR